MDANNNEKTIFDKELVSFCKASVIQYMRLVPELVDVSNKAMPDEKGKKVKTKKKVKRVYKLWVKGTWEAEELLLITANRKEARMWSNLDRAEEYFRTHFQYQGELLVMINGT